MLVIKPEVGWQTLVAPSDTEMCVCIPKGSAVDSLITK